MPQLKLFLSIFCILTLQIASLFAVETILPQAKEQREWKSKDADKKFDGVLVKIVCEAAEPTTWSVYIAPEGFTSPYIIKYENLSEADKQFIRQTVIRDPKKQKELIEKRESEEDKKKALIELEINKLNKVIDIEFPGIFPRELSHYLNRASSGHCLEVLTTDVPKLETPRGRGSFLFSLENKKVFHDTLSSRDHESIEEYCDQRGIHTLVPWEARRVLPAWNAEGKVVVVNADEIYVSLGAVNGVRFGNSLLVSRNGTEIKDPSTGIVLGKEIKRIAELEVVAVQERLCKAKLATRDEKLPKDCQIGDVVTFDKKRMAIAVLPLELIESTVAEGGVNAKGAVSPSEAANIGSRLDVSGKTISEYIITEMVKLNHPIVERALLQRAINQIRLTLEKDATGSLIFDKKLVREFGEQIGAAYILGGTTSEFRIINHPENFTRSKNSIVHSVMTNVRIIDVASGEVIMTTRGRFFASP